MAGVASRRACEHLIFDGQVKVNGKVVLIPQTQVKLGRDRITVADKPIKSAQAKVYFMLNKPNGYVCTSQAVEEEKIVLDLFKEIPERLFTVGRLDKDTNGLLIVTNDGHFANKVIHPSSNIQKEYLAKTDQEVTDEHLVIISKGIRIDGVRVKPLQVKKVRKGTIKMIIMDGKKREVRLLLEAAGLKTLSLTRIRIGSLHLGSLPVGGWKEMTTKERELIFE